MSQMERSARISDCGKYRYGLRRVWDRSKLRALFVMLNPSTADGDVDDATIRSCIRLSKALGYGSFEVVNLFAFRSTDPRALAEIDDPVGSLNELHIGIALKQCDVTICAWGAHPMARKAGADFLARLLMNHALAYCRGLYCLGLTKSGAPKHPLYVKSSTALQNLFGGS